jgi:hypothetical protein
VDRRQRLSVEDLRVGRGSGSERRLSGCEVEAALTSPTGFHTRKQIADPRIARQRLHHELDRSAARQPETPRLVGRHAVGDYLALDGAQPVGAHLPTMSSSTQPPDTEPSTSPSSRTASMAPGAAASSPRPHDSDEQNAPARIKPLRAAFQHFEIDAIHDSLRCGNFAVRGRIMTNRHPHPC